jgi:hypothetical protein
VLQQQRAKIQAHRPAANDQDVSHGQGPGGR